MAVETRRCFTLYLAAGGPAARRTSRSSPRQLAEGLLTSLRPGERQAAAAWHTAHCAPTIAVDPCWHGWPGMHAACLPDGLRSSWRFLPPSFYFCYCRFELCTHRASDCYHWHLIFTVVASSTNTCSFCCCCRTRCLCRCRCLCCSRTRCRCCPCPHARRCSRFFARLRSWTPSTVSDV